MAVQTLRLYLVFAVGLFVNVGSLPVVSGTNDAGTSDALTSVHSQSTKISITLRFLEQPQDAYVTEGGDAVLRCRAESSTGGLTIEWLYDADGRDESVVVAETDGRWQFGPHRSDLAVLRASAEGGNVGDYRCLARNANGAMVSETARVRLARIDSDVSVTASGATVHETQALLLRCAVRSTPPADIYWQFNQLPLPKDKRYVPLLNGTLLINDIKRSESGSYRCAARNRVMNRTKTSKPLEVRVLPLSEIEPSPPTFLAPDLPRNRTVLIGETVEFDCPVAGWPTPTVQWINNKNVTLSNSSTLIVRNAQSKDSGNYICVAVNSVGHGTLPFHLDVYQKPYFNVTPTSELLVPAQVLRINCQAKGIPQPKIIWLKDGRPLRTNLRILQVWSGLVFRYTGPTDGGIYQCVAQNAVGLIRAVAQIEINSSLSPDPPRDVQCRPYNEHAVCLSWKVPPEHSARYIVVHRLCLDDNNKTYTVETVVEKPVNSTLIDKLNSGTNCTFHVVLFAPYGSDDSEKVTCRPGVEGHRNVDIETINGTTVVLKWAALSFDTACDGSGGSYTVEWRHEGATTPISSAQTTERRLIVSGLLPTVDYLFRVKSNNDQRDESWVMYSLADVRENGTSNRTQMRAPLNLREDVTNASTSAKVLWDKVANAKYYTVCYKPLVSDANPHCREEDFLKSYTPKFAVENLSADTPYVFRVRAHDQTNAPGVATAQLIVRTRPDVPSSVADLRYRTLNATTACLTWRPPERLNGQLKKYLVFYTMDKNLSLQNMTPLVVSPTQKPAEMCDVNRAKGAPADVVSTYLNFSSRQMLVLVQAVNMAGRGPLSKPITIVPPPDDRAIEYVVPEGDQKFGIVLGLALAALCILCCVSAILLRRRCLKRREAARARLAATSRDYHRPPVAHYTSQLGTVQVRMEEEPCVLEGREADRLVSGEQGSSNIPPVAPDQLDTKGANDDQLPNGYANGARKGRPHIIENPHYYVTFERNGNVATAQNKSEPLLKRHRRLYDEDTNSNVKPPSKLYRQLYRLLEPNGKQRKHEGASPQPPSSNGHARLGGAADCAGGRIRFTPVIGPNG